jgi:arabinose-5-phosphate isomerase
MDIKLVVFDFDGVFTDGKCYFDKNGNILKYYDVKDGKALSLLREKGVMIGLISSYKSNSKVFWNGDDIEKNISDHLKFDLVSIGSQNKLEVLNSWLIKYNLNYSNVAYIGDDLNDIPILELVKFSGCPNNAIDKCKNIVNYVCKKNGGDGCVREFTEKILENNNNDDIICQIKREVNYQLDNFNSNDVQKIIDIIHDTNKSKNHIYLSGVGKSENIAMHCCDLLKSISMNCYYININNALHGNIGTLHENDIVILFSKSGNTKELIDIIPYIHNKKCLTIGICCDANSKFEKLCGITLKLPFGKEIDGNIKDIPTNSYMSQLIFSNIIVSKLKESIDINQYKENHPAGNIGNNLKIIKECMITNYPKIIMDNEILLHDVLLQMTNYHIGCCFFVNNCDELYGILTDGDIRRIILKDKYTLTIKKTDINKNYYYETDLTKFICDCKKYTYIPVLDNKKIIGIITMV